MIEKNSKINADLLDFDLNNQLNKLELKWLDEVTYNIFHKYTPSKEDMRMMISIRQKHGLDVQENFMISDYEATFEEKYNK